MIKIDISPLSHNYNEIDEWIDKNIQGECIGSLWSIEFELEADAVLFKLRFG